MRLRSPLVILLYMGAAACSRPTIEVDSVESSQAPLGFDSGEALPGDDADTSVVIGVPDGDEEPAESPMGEGCGEGKPGDTGVGADTGCEEEVPGDSGLHTGAIPGEDTGDTAEPPGDDTGAGDSPPSDTAAPGDTDWSDTGETGDGDTGGEPGGTVEFCNGLDDDGDGEIDEEAVDALVGYADVDGDGHGDAASPWVACALPFGFVEDGDDCDDTTSASHPGAEESCDGEDNDCNGATDDDATDGQSWYPDADGDGFGAAEGVLLSCEGPAGYAPTSDDCDDGDATVAPSAVETCNLVDDDCDGETDEDAVDATSAWVDADGDGFGGESVASGCAGIDPCLVLEGGDCDDALGWVYPDAPEYCDGVDSNCDHDLDAGAVDALTWYADADADGYGAPADTIAACDAPSGFVEDASDCDDTDAARAPNAAESCNGVDDDCDGVVDNGVGTCGTPDSGDEDTGETGDTGGGGGGGPTPDDSADSGDTGTPPDPGCEGEVWYADVDGDAWGDEATAVEGCQPDLSWVAEAGDCDDLDPSVSPSDLEYCDGLDNDCNGMVDDSAEDVTIWYFDADGDGVGVGSAFERGCSPSASYVASAGDCDDSAPAVFPGAEEVCDGIDNDCDEGADEVSAVDAPSWFVDYDGDGYAGEHTRTACSQPSNGYPSAEDCDDEDAGAFPGGIEICNDIDDDCNGAVDDGTSTGATWWYFDADGDGYGEAATAAWSCSSILDHVTAGTDCDDADRSVAPSRREVCDLVDNNCDGVIDEAGASGELVWYADADADGFGDRTSTTEACAAPAGFTADYDDCDDADATAHPDAVETCGDGVDNDCDGISPVCGPWGERKMSGADAWFHGELADDDAGRSVAFVGDVDGDGLDDWAVGVTSNDRGSTDGGSVFLFGGDAADEMTAATAAARVSGGTASDYLGWAIAGAGDVDGDGLAEVLIGAYNANTGGTDAGAVYLLGGGLAGTESVGSARLTVLGSTAYDIAGYALDAGRDVDGDGVGDLAIGAPYEDSAGNRAGAAYLVNGTRTGTMDTSAADAIRTGEIALDRAGSAVALVGDLDGDGFGEWMVGAWGDSTVGPRSGAVYVEFGPLSGTASLASADTKWLGVRTGDRAGLALSAAGDVDGDGLDDALVGAPYGTAAYLVGNDTGVLSLSAATATFTQEVASSRLGTSVSGGGDIDGDGFADVVLGAPNATVTTPSTGAAYVLRGPLSGTVLVADADGLLRGDVANDYAGTSVSNRGDVDGDGLSDVLVGAVGSDDGGAASGSAWLFLGTTP
jgi:hypothetical protein